MPKIYRYEVDVKIYDEESGHPASCVWTKAYGVFYAPEDPRDLLTLAALRAALESGETISKYLT